jgi:tRNA (cytidine32/guanosine34-2'-O)-methyltransferase
MKESIGEEALLAEPHIVSVDLYDMAPVEGCTIIKGDITREKTIQEIQSVFQGKDVDLVVSDGAPDVLGDHDFDQFIQHQLVLAAINLATRVLKKGGNFIAKVFRGKDIGLLVKQTKKLFDNVYMAKPKTCRNSSIEAFMVATGFKGKEVIGL